MKFVLVLFLGLIGVRAAAEVQELPVRDFRGGLVNGVANSLIQDNQAVVLENFDIDPYGALTPRRGLTQVLNADTGRIGLSKLFGYYVNDGKTLLAQMRQKGRNATPSLDTLSEVLVKCTNGACSSFVVGAFYHNRISPRAYSRLESYVVNNNIVIVGGKSHMTLFDGNKVFPGRPTAPGQIVALPLDSVGKVTGVFQYSYLNFDTLPNGTLDTSVMATPSMPVSVHKGKVLLNNIWTRHFAYLSPVWSGQYTRLVIRKAVGDSLWYLLKNIGVSDTTFIDTFSNPSTVIAADIGYEADGGRPDSTCWDQRVIAPPGSPTIAVDITSIGTGSYGGGINEYPTCLDSPLTCNVVGYQIVWVDSAGRWAPSPIHMVPVSSHTEDLDADTVADSVWEGHLYDIQLAPANIVRRYIVRYELPSCQDTDYVWYGLPSPTTDSVYRNLWPTVGYIIADLDDTATSYTDRATLYYRGSIFPNNNMVATDGLIENEEYADDDSLLGFAPSSIAYHGDRMWAVGDPQNLNYIYYSDFGRPTTWPFDKFIKIASRQGDWFVKLVGTEDALLAFRQNSIVRLTGLSLFQFNVEEISSGVGLGAVNSFAQTNEAIYFMHNTGAYIMGNNGGVPVSISSPIKGSIDSITTLQKVVGNGVFGDYWMSYNGRTYVFSQSPAPHWKSYSFGLKDAVLYEKDTLKYDFGGDKYLFVKDNDSIYQYALNGNDSTDAGATISCRYRSKFFMDDAAREKIVYVDLYGTGATDSVTINLWSDSTTIRKTMTILPNFRDSRVDRVPFDEICERASIEIITKARSFTLTGFSIGFIPWDRGKL